MLPDPRFGRFRVTRRTVFRPPRDVFEPRFDVDQEVHEALRAIERADQELRRFRPDTLHARRLLEDALARNAYGTASIEGNPLTLDEVESLLVRGPTPDARVHPDEREILNYAAFIERLPGRTPPAGPDDVRGLHAELFEHVLPDAGRFKDALNFIGKRPEREVVYVPTPPERVEVELDNALAWLHEAPEHPLVRAMVFFHELQGIHPFRDGNGRIGRAITTLLLHAAGYEGVRYALVDYRFNADRDAYYATLAEVERNGWDYTPWVRYMANVLRATFEGAVHTFLFREGLPEDLRERQVRVAEWFARLPADQPVKFNDVHAAFPTVAVRTLKRDLATLRDAGVLIMEGARKGAVYRLAR